MIGSFGPILKTGHTEWVLMRLQQKMSLHMMGQSHGVRQGNVVSWKGWVGSGHGLFQGNVSVFTWKDIRKPQQTASRMVCGLGVLII
jgi:hypothetical protein